MAAFTRQTFSSCYKCVSDQRLISKFLFAKVKRANNPHRTYVRDILQNGTRKKKTCIQLKHLLTSSLKIHAPLTKGMESILFATKSGCFPETPLICVQTHYYVKRLRERDCLSAAKALFCWVTFSTTAIVYPVSQTLNRQTEEMLAGHFRNGPVSG